MRYGILQRDAFVADQVHDQFRSMDHFQFAAQVRIFIFQGIQTVGARSDNFFHLIAIEMFDVGSGQLAEEGLVAQPTGRITAAQFLFSQYGKSDAGGFENFHQGPAGLQIPGVKSPGTTDP